MPNRPEHDLLLRHFASWAATKSRDVDIPLIDQMLDLRSTYDELPATYWPAGSIEDLLLRLWPSKGDVEPPAPDVVASSLDAYVRFLRGTGRMAAKSASPDELGKEAKRSAPRMVEAAADRSAWSTGKTLNEYGREIGVELDGVPDIETLRGRLQQVDESWNSLPFHERRRRMPGPDDDPSLSGAKQLMKSAGLDDPLQALILGFRYELPDGELPPADVTAPIVRNSAYLRSLLALCEWIGDGVEVTGTGVLRPAAAHQAYDELGLVEWTKANLRRGSMRHPVPAAERMGLEARIEAEAAEPWRNAADCEPLDRLWRGGVASGLITIDRRTARSTIESTSDEEWLSTGVRAVLQLLDDLHDRPYAMSGLAYAMLRSYTRQGTLVPWAEIVDFADYWHNSDEDRAWAAEYDVDLLSFRRSMADHSVAAVADTGILEESKLGLRLTPFGDVAVSAWLSDLTADG